MVGALSHRRPKAAQVNNFLCLSDWWLDDFFTACSRPVPELARSLAGRASRRPGLRLGVEAGRRRREVLKESGAEPAFHAAAAVPVAADLFPDPLQLDGGTGERVG